MGLFDNLEAKACEIADKTGLAVTDVHAIANTFQANLTSSDPILKRPLRPQLD